MNSTLTSILLAALIPLAAVSSPQDPWPKVVKSTASFKIDTNAERIEIIAPLKDAEGRTRYTLFCVGGKREFIDQMSDRTKVNFVPDMMCLLNEGERLVEGSLLSEDAAPAWFSRGQFVWDQMVGACGKYPEFSFES